MATQRDRVERAIALLPFLAKHSKGGKVPVPLDLVKKEFGYSDKELVQDIDALIMCGPDDWSQIMIDVDEKGIHVTAPKIHDSLPLTIDEAVMLALAAQPLASAGRTPLGRMLKRARAKIMKGLADHHADDAVDLRRRVKISSRRPPSEWVNVVDAGLRKCQKIKLDYFAVSTQQLETHVVSPLMLRVFSDRWYMDAYSDQANGALRMFRLDQFKRAEVLAETARPADPADLEKLERHGLYVPSGNEIRVKVSYSSKAALKAREQFRDRAKPAKNGSVEVELVTDTPVWVASQVFKWAGEASVMDPEKVREIVKKASEEALARYGVKF